MSDHLTLDGTAIAEAGAALGQVGNLMSSESVMGHQLSAAVGGGNLGGKVDHFAGMWQIRRDKMVNDVTALTKILNTVTEAFGQADSGLADSLDGGRPGSSGAPTIRVEYGQLRNAADRLHSGRLDIDMVLTRLMIAVDWLVTLGYVTDTSSVAFQQKYRDFSTGAGKVIAALDGLATFLTTVASTLEKTDTELADSIRKQ